MLLIEREQTPTYVGQGGKRKEGGPGGQCVLCFCHALNTT